MCQGARYVAKCHSVPMNASISQAQKGCIAVFIIIPQHKEHSDSN